MFTAANLRNPKLEVAYLRGGTYTLHTFGMRPNYMRNVEGAYFPPLYRMYPNCGKLTQAIFYSNFTQPEVNGSIFAEAV